MFFFLFQFDNSLSYYSSSLFKRFANAIRRLFSSPTILSVYLELMKVTAIVTVLITRKYTPMRAKVSSFYLLLLVSSIILFFSFLAGLSSKMQRGDSLSNISHSASLPHWWRSRHTSSPTPAEKEAVARENREKRRETERKVHFYLIFFSFVLIFCGLSFFCNCIFLSSPLSHSAINLGTSTHRRAHVCDGARAIYCRASSVSLTGGFLLFLGSFFIPLFTFDLPSSFILVRSCLTFSPSGFIERESKDLPFAFTLSIFSGFLFERALSLRVEYIGAWTRWGKVVDMLLYLYPTNPQVKQMIAIFLTSYRSLLLQKKALSSPRDEVAILDSLSLKPLVALALSRWDFDIFPFFLFVDPLSCSDLEDTLKRQTVSLLRDVSQTAATSSLKVFAYSFSFLYLHSRNTILST